MRPSALATLAFSLWLPKAPRRRPWGLSWLATAGIVAAGLQDGLNNSSKLPWPEVFQPLAQWQSQRGGGRSQVAGQLWTCL